MSEAIKLSVLHPATKEDKEVTVSLEMAKKLAMLGLSTRLTNTFAGRKGDLGTGELVPASDKNIKIPATMREIYNFQNSSEPNKRKLYESALQELDAIFIAVENGTLNFRNTGTYASLDRAIFEAQKNWARQNRKKAPANIDDALNRMDDLKYSNQDAYQYFMNTAHNLLEEQEKAASINIEDW